MLKTESLLLLKRFEIIEKLYASKTFLKMAGGRMHTPQDPPLAISYRNHQKSLAYFSYLAPLVLFFLLKGRVKRGGHCAMYTAILLGGAPQYVIIHSNILRVRRHIHSKIYGTLIVVANQFT